MKTSDEDFNKWYDTNKYTLYDQDCTRDIAKLAWKECRKRSTIGYIDLKRTGELLGKASKTAFLAAGGTEEQFKVWYKKHCTQNVK